MALGWLLGFRCDAVAPRRFGVAGVALGDIHFHFAWQAWHLVSSTVTLRGRRGTHSIGLALVDRHFVWQAWHAWHWAGSGGALGFRYLSVSPASKTSSSAHIPGMTNLGCEASRCVQRACHKVKATLSGINPSLFLAMIFMFLCIASSGMSPCTLAVLSMACRIYAAWEKGNKPRAYRKSCRWIGGRRYPIKKRKHRKNTMSGQILFLCFHVVLVLSTFYLCISNHVSQYCYWQKQSASKIELHENLMLAHGLCLTPVASWCLSKLVRNRLMHALCGNGMAGKGSKGNKGGRATTKGQGKGKSQQESSRSQNVNPFAQAETDHQHLQDMYSMARRAEEQQNDRQYRARIRDALPEAAWIHHITVLIQSEWSERVCKPHELTAAGGISYIPKESVPDILKRIGYTQSPCAMVTTQSARDLGIPYPSQEVRCSLEVSTPDGSKETVETNKFLTQLGYGRPVERVTHGPCVQAPRTMHKVVARFDSPTGLQDGELTGRIVAEAVCKHIHSALFVDVVVRQDNTCTLMVQDSAVHTLLKASGQHHVYFRLHGTDPEADQLEVIWLPERTTHDDALTAASEESAFGLALKRNLDGPRYGVRFQSVTALDAYASKHGMGEKHKWGRFRASNIPSSVGLHGVNDMLAPLGWTIEEIDYFGDSGVVFLASAKGDHDHMHFIDHNNQKVPVQIKALNERARAMSKAKAQASARQPTLSKAASASGAQTRANVQKALFTKRNDKDKTGETPPPKQARQEQQHS